MNKLFTLLLFVLLLSPAVFAISMGGGIGLVVLLVFLMVFAPLMFLFFLIVEIVCLLIFRKKYPDRVKAILIVIFATVLHFLIALIPIVWLLIENMKHNI